MVGGTAHRHAVGEVEPPHPPHPARAHRACAVGAVLGEDQVPGPDLGDGLVAAVGHLDAGLGGQALVEPVAGELLDEVPDALGLLDLDLVGLAAGDELLALLGHQLAVLLPHRLAQGVGLAEREPGQVRGELHDLLLVDHDPVGLLEMSLHERVLVGDRSAAVLAVDEVLDEVHRARPVQRHHRDDVLDALRLQALERVPHPGRLQLEHPEGARLGQELIRARVVERERVRVEADPARLLDEAEGVGDHGQGLEPEEVHLEQAQLLDRPHRVAGDQLRPLGVLVERHPIHQGLVRDDHRGGVHRGVAGAALERAGHCPHLPHPLVALDLLGERRGLLERLVEGDVEREAGHQLGDAVGLPVGEAEHAGHVADDRLGPHGSEGDDVGDPVRPVAVHHVADDLVPPVVREVDVHVRHRDPLGVQESLEDEPVADGVHVGDAEAVGDERAGGRAAPRADRDALPPGVGDEVPHHQEVARETHLGDHAQLVAQALHDRVARRSPVAARETLQRQVLEVGVEGVTVGHLVVRQVELAEL